MMADQVGERVEANGDAGCVDHKDYEQAMIEWAQRYNGYERIADSDHLEVIYGPLRWESLATGDIPEWAGIDLLRGWAFYVARAHRWSGHDSIFADHPEFELIADAVRNHPMAQPDDLPPPRVTISD